MSASNEPAITTAPQPQKPSSELLDNLIDVLIHPTYHTPGWLEAISEKITDPSLAIGKIGTMIRLGAEAGVDEETTRKLVVAIVAADELGWKDEKIDFLVTGIYKEHRTREENDRRRREGLPVR